MARVSYDDRSLSTDDQRLWLVSGEVHYFRIPAQLWRDRLLKAKRGGLNCVSTPLAWNIHEPVEGQWCFDDQADIEGFMDIASELGLYVILRAGPYVGADWPLGGLPPWLLTRSGMNLRSSGAAFTHYFDRFYRQALSRLVDWQAPRGGPILAIQNEHDYTQTTMPDRLNYLQFISQLIRRAGFEVPILTSNRLSQPSLPDAIECVTTDGDEVQEIKRLRISQPLAPVIVSEMRTGSGDCWASPAEPVTPPQAVQRAMETLGCGGQFNLYMFCGGTNFGSSSGRNPQQRFAFGTTSYDCGAPVSETGALTDKYYRLRPVNMFANHMGFSLATCFLDEPGVTIHNTPGVLNIAGPYGHWAIVSAGGGDAEAADVSLPTGEMLRVPLAPLGACAVGVDVTLSASHKLDYANVMPLGFFGDKVLLLTGPAGWQAVVSINGSTLEATIPAEDAALPFDHEGLLVVLVNSDLACRTWPLDDAIVFGPRFVGQSVDEVEPYANAKEYEVLTLADATLASRKFHPNGNRSSVNGGKSASSAAPKLGTWKRMCVCTEPVSDDLKWNPLKGPTDADRLGQHDGYTWYRVEIDMPRARKVKLLPSSCGDRATIYVNSALAGVWGLGPDATLEPLGVSLKRGRNVLVMLVETLGRFTTGERMGQPKGLAGHLYAAAPLKVRKGKLKASDPLSKRLFPRQQAHLADMLGQLPLQVAQYDMTLKDVCPVQLRFDDLPCHVGILVNGRLAGLFINEGSNFGEVTLGSELQKGKNTVSLLAWGGLNESALTGVRIYSLTENLTEDAAWSWRPWRNHPQEGPVVGKDQPAWYSASFKGHPGPLALHVIGAHKGQIRLNNRQIGGFWNIGPQSDYYLPECWLKDDNELLLFEETGTAPSGTRLTKP
jgi:hypothetical protein